jgi:hypothetical protein
MNNNTNTVKRASYGFNLDFPATPFTIRGLHRQKRGTIKYITLYMRVKKALKDGVIAVSGKADPKKVRKGRKELMFTRVDAKTTSVTATKVTA